MGRPQWVKGQCQNVRSISRHCRDSDPISIGDGLSPSGPSGSWGVDQTTHCLGCSTGEVVGYPSSGNA